VKSSGVCQRILGFMLGLLAKGSAGIISREKALLKFI
jgi:hypothetical protein